MKEMEIKTSRQHLGAGGGRERAACGGCCTLNAWHPPGCGDLQSPLPASLLLLLSVESNTLH